MTTDPKSIAEREAIVAWLRLQERFLKRKAEVLRASDINGYIEIYAQAKAMGGAADAIERGDHLGEDK